MVECNNRRAATNFGYPQSKNSTCAEWKKTSVNWSYTKQKKKNSFLKTRALHYLNISIVIICLTYVPIVWWSSVSSTRGIFGIVVPSLTSCNRSTWSRVPSYSLSLRMSRGRLKMVKTKWIKGNNTIPVWVLTFLYGNVFWVRNRFIC